MTRLEPPELNDPAVWRANLGRKATMRLRNPGDPIHPFTEAVGVIRSVATDASGEAVITIVTRRGEERSAPVEDVLAAKLF